MTLPNDITGGFIIELTTECGSYKSSKEYLMLIADKEIKIELSDVEQKALSAYKNRKFTNGIESLRADIQPIIEYYDKYLSTNI